MRRSLICTLALTILVSLGWYSTRTTAMPSPPSSYIDITGSPASATVLQADFNAGTYGGVANSAWFRYVAIADIVLGTFTNKGGTFVPRVRLYAYDSGAMTLKTTGPDSHAFWYRLTGGETYYVEIRNNTGGGSNFDFLSSFETAPLNPTIPAGSIVINDDAAGFAATIFTPDGTFLGFSTVVPGGEIGTSLRTGGMLVHDRYAELGTELAVLNYLLGYVTSVDTSPVGLAGQFPGVSNDETQFWVVNRSIVPSPVHTVSKTGTVSSAIASVTPGSRVSAIGVSPDQTILYWAEGNTSTAIHRHNLLTDTPLSDLYDVPELSGGDVGSVALTGINNQPGDLLVQPDGTIVTWYRNNTLSKDVLLHLSASGTLLHSMTYAHPIRVNHLAWSPSGSSAVRLWLYLDNFQDTGRIQNFVLATGAADSTFDTALFSEGESLVVDSDQIFGPSGSCTIFTIGYPSTPTLQTPIPRIPTATPCVTDCSPPGSPGTTPMVDTTVVLPAWLPSCAFGGTVASAADLTNSEVWDPQ